ncbi:unnamed protein product [Acanthosepion pharaonis]|uniref:Uncharacterized protein n=1 Tax=Acanthosepion pharaonis TaxID=158019 RepID=A0A812E8K9_ACAPH|nr:unnamed protein product [Sepia pharaonis]
MAFSSLFAVFVLTATLLLLCHYCIKPNFGEKWKQNSGATQKFQLATSVSNQEIYSLASHPNESIIYVESDSCIYSDRGVAQRFKQISNNATVKRQSPCNETCRGQKRSFQAAKPLGQWLAHNPPFFLKYYSITKLAQIPPFFLKYYPITKLAHNPPFFLKYYSITKLAQIPPFFLKYYPITKLAQIPPFFLKYYPITKLAHNPPFFLKYYSVTKLAQIPPFFLKYYPITKLAHNPPFFLKYYSVTKLAHNPPFFLKYYSSFFTFYNFNVIVWDKNLVAFGDFCFWLEKVFTCITLLS